jgi:hypothetical protein
MPVQRFVAVPVDSKTMGELAVPEAWSAPLTLSSERAGSSPAPIKSVVAKASVTPGSIVSETPGATVRSPATA